MNDGGTVRAALYARVSTTGKGQDPELQLAELRTVAAQRGWSVVGEFVDNGVSGSKDRRPALDWMIADANAGKIDVVAVWRFDRFARSTRHLLEALETFRVLGVGFFSLREQVDTTTPAGRALFTMIATVAELERDLIRERVRAGIDKAKRDGKRLGRPRRSDLDLARVRRLLAAGQSLSAVARTLAVPRATVQSALRRGAEKPLPENAPARSATA